MSRMATIVILAALALLCGCRNTGVSLVVGEQMLLPEISDAGDNLSVRLYEDVKGARIWSAKNSIVRAEYSCATTNSYFGIVATQSAMKLDVAVEPCEMEMASKPDFAPPREGQTQIKGLALLVDGRPKTKENKMATDQNNMTGQASTTTGDWNNGMARTATRGMSPQNGMTGMGGDSEKRRAKKEYRAKIRRIRAASHAKE